LIERNEGKSVVNEDFEKFNKQQQAHKAHYLGSVGKQKPGLNDPDYNNQSNTDKSVGATGRKV